MYGINRALQRNIQRGKKSTNNVKKSNWLIHWVNKWCMVVPKPRPSLVLFQQVTQAPLSALLPHSISHGGHLWTLVNTFFFFCQHIRVHWGWQSTKKQVSFYLLFIISYCLPILFLDLGESNLVFSQPQFIVTFRSLWRDRNFHLHNW